MNEKTKEMQKKVTEKVEDLICKVADEGIQIGNVDYVYKLVDIHKDLANEEYWDTKKEDIEMRFKNYGRNSYGRNNYGRNSYGNESYGRMRDSRGRFMEKGVDSMYRGEDVLNDMFSSYGRYSEGKEAYSRGNYGAKTDTMESLGMMLESVVDFIAMLKEEAGSQEEMDLIKRYAKTISEV